MNLRAQTMLQRPSAVSTPQPPFAIRMEPGHEELWLAIRSLPQAKRCLSAHDLATQAQATTGAAERYLQKLVKAGFADIVGKTTDQLDCYAIRRMQVDPVVLDQRGKPSADWERRRAIWRQIRSFGVFTVAQLWMVLREHGQVTLEHVETYIARLVAADFLVILEKMGRKPEAFQLRPSRNTGPLPPRLCEAQLVYDVNCGQFFGRGLAREVTL